MKMIISGNWKAPITCLLDHPTNNAKKPCHGDTSTLEAKHVKGLNSALNHMLEVKGCETPAEPVA